MKLKNILQIALILLISNGLYAQVEPQLQIAILDNDKIADVNIDQEKFINSLKGFTELVKNEFIDIEENQKIAVLLVAHKVGNPTIEIYSNPKISSDQETGLLQGLEALKLENTKLVDFPLLIFINSKFENLEQDFTDFSFPREKIKEEYENADLKKKYVLNKDFAVEILSVLSAYEIIVDDQFVGVQNFGNLMAESNFKVYQDIEILTSTNENYWRACLEMSIGNQLIPVTKIFILASQGEFDYALKYIEMVGLFSNTGSISDGYMKEMSDRLNVFNSQLNLELKKGIAAHDNGDYENAIHVYKEILNNYPNSAWTKYELYYSQSALDLENEDVETDDRERWDKAKVGVYKSNPLYTMDVRASNGAEAYVLFRRQSISQLFQDKENRLIDVYKYADIAMDLKVYDFAAQLFWFSFTSNTDNTDALNKFLYCVEKLGVEDLKTNFKGDFQKVFKSIEKEKEKEMKESKIYNSFEK